MMTTVTTLPPTEKPRTSTHTASRKSTPPAIKWLLNERAALAGAQQSAIEAIPLLQRQVARAERELAKAEKALERISKNLQALDRTLAQVDSRVDPLSGGVVNAWQGRYGQRGALSQCVLALLQKAAPAPMALNQIVDGVEAHFGIAHAYPKSRKKLRDSIRTRLRDLQAKTGKVKPHRPAPGHPAGYWVYQELASMNKLRELADAADGREAAWP